MSVLLAGDSAQTKMLMDYINHCYLQATGIFACQMNISRLYRDDHRQHPACPEHGNRILMKFTS